MTRAVIVGAGITGPVTAMALQKAGFDAVMFGNSIELFKLPTEVPALPGQRTEEPRSGPRARAQGTLVLYRPPEDSHEMVM